jgi:UDP-N-acetylmuramoylalanine--D-glutamate ligase
VVELDVLVVGLRATGAAVADWLVDRGDVVTVVEEQPGQPGYEDRKAAARARGVTVVEGVPDWDVLVAGADLVVPSPGVHPDHPVMAAAHAARLPVRGDLDLAVEAAPVPVVAVTGTNGKSTVTSLVSAMLERSGRRAPAVGNIGRVVLEALAEPADVFVIEASSFQLHTVTPAFAPAVAILLNLADDHLDWHGSFDAYVADKRHVFAYQRPDALLVANRDDPVVVQAVRDAPARVAWFSIGSPEPGVAGWRGPVLVGDDGVDLFELAGPWAPHDRANIAAAAVAARALGARPDAMRAATGDFVRLHHRTEPVGKAGGVEFVDDSKATNPHATLAAVAGYPSVVLLAGGLSKGVDLSVLTTVRDRLRAVVAIGARPDEVEAAFAGAVATVRADSMRAAVRTAADLAVAGDVVLLSPACASFDWYDGYAARGDDFRREVETLLEENA